MMKNIYRIAFALVVSTIIFSSCSNRKIGYFNNHYSSGYYVAQAKDDVKKDEPVYASVDNKIEVEKPLPTKQIISVYKQKFPSNTSDNKGTIETKKLTREEKKEIKAKLKEAIKNNKENDSSVNTVILVILAILLPPLAVALVDGLTGPFWLDILLTLLFYVPGLIYALFRIFR